MSWKAWVKDYFTFSKKERLAAFSLLALAGLVYLLPKLFSATPTTTGFQADTTLLNRAADEVKGKTTLFEEAEKTAPTYYEPTLHRSFTEGALFTFDPNTLPTEGWQKLGLSNRTIKTLNNYRNKGGRFYKKEDLKKIWGLPEAFYDRVAPYIQIASNNPVYDGYPAAAPTPAKGKRNISAVAVNTADTTELIALPGIGPKLAARIINFREKLGGFYSTEQIGETYGLPDSTFHALKPYLQVDAGAVKKINLNTATKDELRNHPYVKWALANAIVEYRARHGSFNSLEELKNIMLMDEATFQKLAPYFSL